MESRGVAQARSDAAVGSRLVSDIRKEFPILSRQVHGKPLTYLDNAATTQKPLVVLDTIRRYYETTNANVHRALHTLGEEATASYEASRRSVQRFIGASSPSEIVFTRGTTEAINLVASAWGRKSLLAGDVILLSEMEHHSNLVPWQLIAAERGCTLAFIPVAADGSLDMDALDRVWTDRVRIVAVSHLSNVLGTLNDVKTLAGIAHSRGALLLVDGAQSVPHIGVDVVDLDCDFLAFSGHKMCGPTGIGVLYGKETLLDATPPFMGGGEMISAVWLDKATWNELPHKFEAGTPNIEGALGLAAAIGYLESIGMADIASYETRLADHALTRLEEVPGLSIIGRAACRGAVFSFTMEGVHPHDVAQLLDEEGIAVRAGHHCAQPLMRKLGLSGTARASLYFYNTREEIDMLARALGRVREFFR